MSPITWMVGLATAALLLTVVVLLITRRSTAGSSALFQQQLLEMRQRLDALVDVQQSIPRELAVGRAEQADTLAYQFSELARLIAGQLESTQSTVGDRLSETGEAVQDVRERLGRLAEVTKRLETLGENVAEVQELLRVPKLRGIVGEVWLQELLRQLFPATLYRAPYTFPDGLRADAVLRIGGRLVAVDAKFPLEACQRMLAEDGDGRVRERRGFDRSVRARIDEIADKYIRPEYGTYDFALMYIPAERVYYEAMIRGETPGEVDSLVAYAMERRVVPVSPHTLYAYLAAVMHGLRGLRVEERARDMLGALDGLQQDLGRFRRSHEVLGRHLENAVRQYGEADRLIGKLRDRIETITGLENRPRPQTEPMAAAPTPDAADIPD